MAIDRGDPNYGTGSAASTNADDINVEDTAGNFTGTEVESVLAEIETSLNAHIGDLADPHQTVTGSTTSVQFNTAVSAPSHSEGLLFYDKDAKVMSFYTDEAEATLNIGTERWVRVVNNTGSTITNGSVVYISGVSSGIPQITKARADSRSTAHSLGVVTHDIENGTEGWLTVAGLVRSLDLSSFSNADTLYLDASTAGELTTTKPSGGDYPVEIGHVLSNSASEGVLFIDLTYPIDTTDVVNNYGEIYTSGNSTVTVATDQNTWYQFLHFDVDGISQGMTPDHTNDHITVLEAGDYKIEATVSFSSDTGNTTYEIQVAKNNGATGFSNIHLERKLGSGGDIGAAQCGGMVTLAANDTIELWIQCTSAAATNPTIRDANLNITRLS